MGADGSFVVDVASAHNLMGMQRWLDLPDRAAEQGSVEPEPRADSAAETHREVTDAAATGSPRSDGGRRAPGGRRVALAAFGLMLVLLGGTAVFVPLSPSGAANGGIIVFVPLGPSSTAISVWQAQHLCSSRGGAPDSSRSGSWAGPCADVALVWGASLVAIATGLVLLLASPFA